MFFVATCLECLSMCEYSIVFCVYLGDLFFVLCCHCFVVIALGILPLIIVFPGWNGLEARDGEGTVH